MRSRTATRTLTALVTVLGLSAGLVVATSGSLAAEPPDEFACADPSDPAESPAEVQTAMTFNNPETEAKDDIREHIGELICGAEEGTEIMVGAHYFGDEAFRKKLAYAHYNGVDVKVIVDGGAVQGGDEHGDYAEYAAMEDVLGDDREARSWIDYCPGETRACIGGGADSREDALMHNKFFLFEKTNGAEKVVVQTSHNFREGRSGSGMWNSAFTVADDPSVYDHYKAYFDDLTDVAPKQDDYYENNDLPQPTSGKYEVFHSPSAGEHNPIMDQLERVDCTADNNTGGTQGGHTIVRVAMWNISGADEDATGTQLARALKTMDDDGCYVDIVADRIDTGEGGTDGPLETLLQKPVGKRHGPEVRKFYKGGDQKGLHSKDILINGTFDGEPDQKVVLTGTHNLTWKSARVNDETTLVIKDAKAYEDFSDYFVQVRKKATLTYQTSKYKR